MSSRPSTRSQAIDQLLRPRKAPTQHTKDGKVAKAAPITPSKPAILTASKTTAVAKSPKKVSAQKGVTVTETAAELERESQIALLKSFDLDGTFGPCIGITREARWQRAHEAGLNPPEDVRALLHAHRGDVDFDECLFRQLV
eukprot:Opistho-2@42082